MGSSHLKDTADELILREKVPRTEPDPGFSTKIPSGQSCSHTPEILTMDSSFKASLNQLDTQFKVALGPLPVQPQDNRSAAHMGRASIKHPGASSTFNPAGHLPDEATGATDIYPLALRSTEKSTLPSRAQQRPSSQESWRTKIWRGLTEFLTLGSHLQATAVEFCIQEKHTTLHT